MEKTVDGPRSCRWLGEEVRGTNFLDQSCIAVIEIQILKTAAKTMHFAKIVYSIRKGYKICLKKVQNLNQDDLKKIKFGQHRGKLG